MRICLAKVVHAANIKSEGKIAEILNKKCIVHRQYRLKNRFFDYFLPEHGLLIERDGEQHYFENTLFSLTLNEQRKIDREKTNLAIASGMRIARIPFWVTGKHLEKEINLILEGKPSYPKIPDLRQLKRKPLP